MGIRVWRDTNANGIVPGLDPVRPQRGDKGQDMLAQLLILTDGRGVTAMVGMWFVLQICVLEAELESKPDTGSISPA